MANSFWQLALGKRQIIRNTVDGNVVDATAVYAVDSAGLQIAGRPWYVDYTPTVDTNALAAGDIFSDTAALTNVAPFTDTPFVFRHVQMIEKQDQNFSADMWFLNSNVSLGSLNAAPSLSDTNGEALQDFATIYTSEQRDLGGFKRWGKGFGAGIPLMPASGTRTLYVALVVAEWTPTFAASSLKMRLWFSSNFGGA